MCVNGVGVVREIREEVCDLLAVVRAVTAAVGGNWF